MLTLVLSAPVVAQGFKIKWVCDAKVQRMYREDLGVVCWDGKTYRKDDPGGIPQYMIDYFDAMKRDLDRKVADMYAHRSTTAPSRTGRVRAQSLSPNSNVPVARAAPEPARKPVSPEAFATIAAGNTREEVLRKLGEPAGSITIPADDGFVEIWTYTMTDGRSAKVRIEAGVVKSLGTDGGAHAR